MNDAQEGPGGGETDDERAAGGFRLADAFAKTGPGPKPIAPLIGMGAFPLIPGMQEVMGQVAQSARTGLVRGFQRQLDVKPLITPLITAPLLSEPFLTAALSSHLRPWAQGMAKLLEPLIRRLPPNWPRDVDLATAQSVIQEEGLPLVWVPRAEIVTSLLAAPDRQARVEILLAHESTVVSDCRAVLTDISHPTLSGQLPLALKALEAFEAGHREAAQALAMNVTETAVLRTLGSYAQARELAAIGPETRLCQLRCQAALSPIVALYTSWRPEWGVPRPEVVSRHVAVHQADAQSYTREYALVTVMAMTSILRGLQERAEDVATDHQVITRAGFPGGVPRAEGNGAARG
jgi:hypothetical protein